MIGRCLLWVLLATCTTPSLAATTALVNGRVVTLGPQGVIENGTVLIADGKVAAVQKTANLPAGTKVIDVAGAWVTPGLFAPSTQLGAMEVGHYARSNDAEAKEAKFSIGFDVSYGLNGATSAIDVARARGVTSAAVFPSSGNSIFSGLGALISLRDQIDILRKARAFAVVELGSSGARAAGGARGAAWVTFHEALREAREGAGADRHDGLLNRIDAEELAPVSRGRTPLLVHVERASDILNVLSLAKSHPELRIVLLGASEGWMVADRIAKSDVPVILCPFENLPSSFEMLGATRHNAARLVKAGVTVAFSAARTPDTYAPELLTQGAGVAVAYGVPWEAAFRAITINPARIFDVATEIGSIERGKRADIVIWDGDPLELGTKVQMVFIDGEQIPLRSRKDELRERYMQRVMDMRAAARSNDDLGRSAPSDSPR